MQKPYFATIDYRHRNEPFYQKLPDMFFHKLLVGMSGSGKTSLLLRFLKLKAEAIKPKIGWVFIDPHGDAAREIYENLVGKFRDRIIYIDLTNPNETFGLNLYRAVSPAKRSLVASNILEAFHRNWRASWGQKMEAILREVNLLLLQQKHATIGDISRVLLNKEFRDSCVSKLTNPDSIQFWQKVFPSYKLQTDLLPILNKMSSLLSHDLMRKILTQNKPISLRKAMDDSKLIIVRAARGAVGTDVINLFLSLFMVSMASAAFSRIDTLPEKRTPFFWALDEFQTFSGAELLGELVAQLRKFQNGLILSLQTLGALDSAVRDSLLSNVGTIICFRQGIEQAKVFEKLFYPVFKAIDFTELGIGQIYLRMVIDGRPSKPFSANTII